MKEIELKQNTLAAKWYRFFWKKYEYSMPKDTCTYYKKTILSFLLIPFTIIGLIIAKVHMHIIGPQEYNYGRSYGLGTNFGITAAFILLPLLFGIEGNTSQKIHNATLLHLWLQGWLILLCVAIGLCLLTLLMAGVVSIIKWFEEKAYDRRYKKYGTGEVVEVAKEPNIISAWFKQLKDRTCSKIKWI